MGQKFLRLGKPQSVHPLIQPYAFYDGKGPGASFPLHYLLCPRPLNVSWARLGGKKVEKVSDLKALFQSSKIVATTCLSINHPLIEKRRFDYCIVDEASQLTLPVCLGTYLLLHLHHESG